MYKHKTEDNSALLTAAFLEWLPTDPERFYIRDVMTLHGNDAGDSLHETYQFHATVKGLSDWYSFKVDSENKPIPASISILPY